MIESDTIRLLRECDLGIKMGVSAFAEVIDYVKDENFKFFLAQNKGEHEALKKEIEQPLHQYEDEGKNPNPVVKGMSWMKTNMMLMMKESDQTIADLITDGCNMGIKSLHRYLNQYKAADEQTKDITKRLIALEEALEKEIRKYL